MNINLLYFVTCIAIFFSCTSPYFRAIEGTGNCPVYLEARKQSGFELRFINLHGKDLKKLTISFDKKYSHTLFGLYSVEKGLIKDSLFKAGDTLTFKFTDDLSNGLYFKIDDITYIPNEIIMSSDDCSTTWQFK